MAKKVESIRPGGVLEGIFSDYPLPDLLIGLLRSNLTGMLEIGLAPARRNAIYFRDGVPISVALPDLGVSVTQILVEQGEILHALRFTVSESQSGYISPATHAASSSSDPDLPPMGLRVRMKASYDCGDFGSEVQVICTALKRFGMFVADNGSNWYVSGAHDPRWDDDAIGDLKQIPGDAFEVVDTGEITPW